MKKYAAWNNIEDQGCKHLSKANFKCLKQLNLSTFKYTQDSNGISEKGCHFISSWKSNRIEFLLLGQKIIIKVTTKQMKKVAKCFLRLNKVN